MIDLVYDKDIKDSVTIEHHTKYKEIHGEDKTTFLTISEHIQLHRKLRRQGKCNTPSEELSNISKKAYKRTDKYLKKHPETCKIKNKSHSDWIRRQIKKDIELKKK